MNKKQVKREYKRLWKACWIAAHNLTKAEVKYMESVKACNKAYDEMMYKEEKDIIAMNSYVENWDALDRKTMEDVLWDAVKEAEAENEAAKAEWNKAWDVRKNTEFKLKAYSKAINSYILFWENYAKKLNYPGAGKKLYNSFFATF